MSSKTPNLCTCCDCGYQWPHGRDGSHSCTVRLRGTLRAVSSALLSLINHGYEMAHLAETPRPTKKRTALAASYRDKLDFAGDALAAYPLCRSLINPAQRMSDKPGSL